MKKMRRHVRRFWVAIVPYISYEYEKKKKRTIYNEQNNATIF